MAEIDQRVQALEQELQILKNQIQSILLDLQEQVLSNTYPALRAGDNQPPAATPSPRPRPDADDNSRAAATVRTMSFDDLGDDDDEDDAPPPPKATSKASKQQKNSNNRNNKNTTNNASQWQAMSELEDWANKKIEQIGAQDTLELINTYAAKGRFSPDEADALMDYVSLHVSHTETPTQPTPPNRPFEFAARPPQNARAQSVYAPAQPTEPPAPAKPPKKGFKAAPPTPAPEPAQPLQSTQPTPDVSAQSEKPEEEPKKRESQNLVLRLIAGVQNAGAGVKWGKNDG